MRRTALGGVAGLVLAAGLSSMTTVFASAAGASPSVSALPSATPSTGVVTLQTVPALQGVRFSLAGITGMTGADGSATVPTRQLDNVAGEVAVPDQQLSSALRVSLDRVVNVPNHPIFHRLLLVNLDVDRAVNIVVDTPSGAAVPTGQVSSVTLQDSLGRTIGLSGKQLSSPVWLASRRPTPDPTGAASKNVVYTVESAIVRGSDVVSAGQLRFEPEQTTTWRIPGIFLSLTVQGDDLLGGKPAGKSLLLTYPDHSVVQVPFDAHHQARITDLPRGTYKLRVRGGLIGLTTQVRLSRNQLVTQIVVTKGDVLVIGLAVVGLIALLAATGLAGRYLRQSRRRRMELSGVPA